MTTLLPAAAFALSLALPWTSRGTASSLAGWDLIGLVGSGALSPVVPVGAAVALALVPAAGVVAAVACAVPGRVAALVTAVSLVLAAVLGALAVAAVVGSGELVAGTATFLVGAASLAVPPVLVLSRSAVARRAAAPTLPSTQESLR